jgi:IS5 family transposase
LFLEFYDNLSDVEASEHCERDLLYQAFVGIGMEDEVPEPTTLVEFRNRLGEQTFKRLFDELVKQLKAKGLLSQKVSAIDATHIEADIALMSMINLLRQGRRKVMWRLGKKDKRWQERLAELYPSEPVRCNGKASDKDVLEERAMTKRFLDEIKRVLSQIS